MKTAYHPAATRGHAHHGWLESHHSFSFASYYNPKRMGFGALRVLNDDTVAGGQGFSTHPHQNMEIISIPLEGDLEHQDSMGNTTIIRQGDVQTMSAGTGVYHSEYNKNNDSPVKFLQIWVIPNKQNVTPRYDQISIRDLEKSNQFYQILSPHQEDEGVWIYQDAWFHLGKFDAERTASYALHKKENGVYLFVLEGDVTIKTEGGEQQLSRRDGYGMWEMVDFEVISHTKAELLLMEVPM